MGVIYRILLTLLEFQNTKQLKARKNPLLIYLVIHFVLLNGNLPQRNSFFVSNKLTYKLRPDLLINEHGKLEPTFIGLIFRNKKILSVVSFIRILICNFNNEY